MIFNRSVLIYVLLLVPILADMDKTNPWEPYMEIYNIPHNHESGVLIDEEGLLFSLITAENYTFPVGRCPVFGKILQKKTDNRKISDTRILNETNFLNDLSTGSVEHLMEKSKKLWFQFSKINDKNNKYYKWISPVKRNSIFGCSQYVNNSEHQIEKSDYNLNCANEKNKGKCLKQPFLYNLLNKNCYILYPVKQRYFNKKDGVSYAPMKYFNQYVYGSSRIHENWSQYCPVKTIKGAVFGKWENGKCNMITPAENVTSKYNRTTCVNSFFEKIDEKPLYHWAFYTNNSCFLINQIPDCFMYDMEGYSTTSISMPTTTIYDLPPCIATSENWIIYANCADGYKRRYICKGGKWVGHDGLTITSCASRINWTNVENLISDKKEDEILQEKNPIIEDEKDEVKEIQEYLINNERESEINEKPTTTLLKKIPPAKKRLPYIIIPDTYSEKDIPSSEKIIPHSNKSTSFENTNPSHSKEINSSSKETMSSHSEQHNISHSNVDNTSISENIPSYTRNATLSKHFSSLSTLKTPNFYDYKFLYNFSSKLSSAEIIIRGTVFLLTALLFF